MRPIFGFGVPILFLRVGRWFTLVWVIFVGVAAPNSAFAQGCAMCANNASSLKSAATRALESGILILLIPVVLIIIGIFGLAYHSRNRFHDAGFSPDGGRAEEQFTPAPESPGNVIEEEPVEVHSGVA